ncbi:alpha-ketoacid dehydrogenase subunit beta [Aliidiomarina celeris]|uniref:alpha-ketoacid dehydrogenase subunit beta n=1 Tax=Aliidiomarina celeris TaxID=2249428 RepID=UPI000DEBF3D8|nr:transketolase C-terminal domain-containing protein [Aliidiomarina celeris]
MSLSYLESLQQALHHVMKQDPNVIVLGEDIIDPYGGAFKVTKGLSTHYPQRVLATPISESAIVGISTGLAVRGFKPVAEIMFGDFMALVADQLLNSACKFALMYQDKVSVPLVVRTPMGGGRGYGPTHSQCLEKMFLGIPGLKVVCPSVFHDPGALLTHSILQEAGPVLFVEYKNLYGLTLQRPDTIRMKTSGSGFPVVIADNSDAVPDIVILSYGGLSEAVLQVMQRMTEEEIHIRLILPSLLSTTMDASIITKYINSCTKVLVTDNNTPGFGWVSETVNWLYQHSDIHNAKVHTLTAQDTVVPAAQVLEDAVLVTPQKLEQSIIEIIS